MIKSGIYQIRNIVDGKIYVGSAVNFERRWVQHRSLLGLNKHHSIYLQRVWNIYGADKFSFEIIEEVEDVKMLLEREQYWINKTQSHINHYGYNVNKNAFSRLGMKATQETKEKLSLAHQGQPAWNKGIKTGKMNPESAKKMCGRTPWNKGTKGVMIAWNKGKKGMQSHTEEWKREQSLRSKGKKMPEAAKIKLSLKLKGNKNGCRDKSEIDKWKLEKSKHSKTVM